MKNIIFVISLFFLSSVAPLFAFGESTQSFVASYSVPVQDSDLKNFSTFEILDYQVATTDTEIHLNYSLPLVLTGGETIPVKLKLVHETSTERFFSGENGTARCQGPWSQMNCETRFNLKLDPTKIEEFILKSTPLNSQLPLLKVALSFSTEPIGFSNTQGEKK